jgi:hypothetical protein
VTLSMWLVMTFVSPQLPGHPELNATISAAHKEEAAGRRRDG